MGALALLSPLPSFVLHPEQVPELARPVRCLDGAAADAARDAAVPRRLDALAEQTDEDGAVRELRERSVGVDHRRLSGGRGVEGELEGAGERIAADAGACGGGGRQREVEVQTRGA